MSPHGTGFYVGTVESNKLDQDGCIGVKIPALGGTFTARVAAQLAGDNRGVVLLPEKNDQVLVAYVLGSDVEWAVIGSLWDVQDATAEELLVSFHRHYRQGSDAAIAMQSAQLDLLRNKNPGLRSVFAWAPFQVIGHTSSPYALTRHN